MYRRIIVPLDGSALAEQALPHAIQMSRLTGAPLHLMRVIDTPAGFYDAYGMAASYAPTVELLEIERGAAEKYLTQVQAPLADDDFAVTTEASGGRVASQICGAAADGDLIVMASHGRGGLARWFLGSVAEEVTRHATVPVLLIRVAGDDARTTPPAEDAELAGARRR